jgi:DNA-binding NarL/FixJ family response regulator
VSYIQRKKTLMQSDSEDIGVWVVEDDPTFRRSLQELLRSTPGMRCEHTFRRCEDALVALKDKGPPEIMLVDIGLPGMSGIEGIRKMKDLSPATEFVVLTVHEERQNVFDAICAGATGYLVKNLPSETIVEKIRESARGGAPMDPLIARRVLELVTGQGGRGDAYGLTDREQEILTLMVKGLTRVDIAEKLFISPPTVNTHSRNIYQKLHVHTRGGAVAKALKERLV